MKFRKGQQISVKLRGNEKSIDATFLGWRPNLNEEDQVFLVIDWKGQERHIHDIFIGEINGIPFTVTA